MRSNILTTLTKSSDWDEGNRASVNDSFVITTGRIVTEETVHTQRFSETIGYRSLLKRGGLPGPLPYLHRFQNHSKVTLGSYSEWNTSLVAATGKYVTWQRHYRNRVVNMPGAQATDTLLLDLLRCAESAAVTQLLVRAKDSKFNSAVSYAESDQVLRMVTKCATSLGEVLYHLRRGNLVGAADTLNLTVGKRQATRFRKQHANIKTDSDVDRSLSNGILQVQYGIRPLISDVIGAAELLAQKVSREVISNVSSKSTLSGYKSTVRSSDLPRGRAVSTLNHRVNVTVKYGCLYSVSNEVTHTLAQLGLTNPLLVAWELVPWSFVVDWFIPIGNAISSWDATVGLDFRSGWKSVKIDDQFDMITDLVPASSTYFFTGKGYTFGTNRSFERTVLNAFPSPRKPVFKSPLSVEHAINAIALLTGFKKTVYFKPKLA